MDLSDIRVHHNASIPGEFNSLAYMQGQDIHMGEGHDEHLPHQGWPAVQQMQGRVESTRQAKGVSVDDDRGLEREADVIQAKALGSNRAEQATIGSAPQAALPPSSSLS
jgi:hypothetical protein